MHAPTSPYEPAPYNDRVHRPTRSQFCFNSEHMPSAKTACWMLIYKQATHTHPPNYTIRGYPIFTRNPSELFRNSFGKLLDSLAIFSETGLVPLACSTSRRFMVEPCNAYIRLDAGLIARKEQEQI